MKLIPITCNLCGTTTPAKMKLWTQVSDDMEIRTYETSCPTCGKNLTETRKNYLYGPVQVLNRKVAVLEVRE
jgi:DNA-directed RNA polymerase subunit N (RpoN/RPB10)